MSRDDDFSEDTKDILAKRVGMKCANPNCRRPTSGPRQTPNKTVNIGVGAHITAASEGGPRYDPDMDPAIRRSAENGIWLCQACAKLIDNDVARYTVSVIRAWRSLSEEAARLDIESPATPATMVPPDVDLIRFYAQCFDRPAFQDHFRQEGSMEDFDKAMEDTITAINTGFLHARNGVVLIQGRGKACLRNSDWRSQMDVIVDLLRAIRGRYEVGRMLGRIDVRKNPNGTSFYYLHDRETADWMDSTRTEIMQVFAGVAAQAGVHPPTFPRPRVRH